MSLATALSANVSAASSALSPPARTSSEDASFIRTLNARISRRLPSAFYDFDAEERWRVEGKALGVLPRQEQRRLVRIAKSGFGRGDDPLSSRAAELLVLTNSGFIEDMIRPHAHRGLEAEVLRQECRAAMWDAIERYDLNEGASFLAFCEWRMKGAISEAIRSDSRLVRLKSRASEIADRALRAVRLLENNATVEQLMHHFPVSPDLALQLAALSQARQPVTPQMVADLLDLPLERLLDVWEWLDQRKLFARIDMPLHRRGQSWAHVADETAARPREEYWTLHDPSVDIEGVTIEADQAASLSNALSRLSAYERRVVELYHGVGAGQEVPQTQMFAGTYQDEQGWRYSAEQSVIADYRQRHFDGTALKTADQDSKRPVLQPIMTATQRELNERYAEGQLRFEPDSPQARELFALSGIPPTSATVQEALVRAYEKMGVALDPLRSDYQYRGDNALEHSEAACRAVRGELQKMVEAAGGSIELPGWGALQSRDVARLKAGRTAKTGQDGIGRKGALRRVAELTGHVDESSGRLTFVPLGGSELAAVVAPPPPAKPLRVKQRIVERARPRDLIDAGFLRPGERMTLLYKGRQHLADLLHDGRVRLLEDGRVFNALSAAAEAAKGVRADPGWNSWHVERSGQRVSLFDIREQYRSLGVSTSAQTKLDTGVRPHLSSLAEVEEPQSSLSQSPDLAH